LIDTEQQALPLQAEVAKPAVRLTTDHARLMMRKRFAAPEWALLEEVAPSTGGGTRYADAVAINLWQSRGHAVHGFEVKVSRGDWLRELKQPEKAEPVFRYCDYWSIVAPKGVVKDGELPPTWGLFELRESGIVQVVDGPKLEAVALTRAFFASLIRRGHEQIEAIAAAKNRLSEMQAAGDFEKRVDERVKQRTRDHERLLKRVEDFSKATGLSLDEYNGPSPSTIKLAQVLEGLQNWQGVPLSRLDGLANELERAALNIRAAVTDSGLKVALKPNAMEAIDG
jgi:hypothetical protein